MTMTGKDPKKTGHKVFISYFRGKDDATLSESDGHTANMICSALESKNIPCWIAPRDIDPGKNWVDAMIDAVIESRLMVLVFSSNSEQSPWVKIEATYAMDENKKIIPFRIENVSPKKTLRALKVYCQWMDAYTQPLERHIDRLVKEVSGYLEKEAGKPAERAQRRQAPAKTEVRKRKREYSGKIHPSVFIGLGGTGKHVLLSLRNKLFEKFRLKNGFPVMAFLCMDTDIQEMYLDNKETDTEMKYIEFEPEEVVDLQIPESVFRRYISSKKDYPHIWEWLPDSIEAQGPPRGGAKQLRPLGRLGYFYKYDEIVEKLEFIKEMITSEENIDKTRAMGIDVDTSKIDVYIVFSIAGGTGSGIFLDTAFTVKEHFRTSMNTIGCAVLPAVFFYDTSHRIFANAYAALKELEYYSLRKDFISKSKAMDRKSTNSEHDFLSRYSANKRKKVIGPPFDVVYLMDNKTSSGFTINAEDKYQLLDMAAEEIFLKSCSPSNFYTKVKSLQSNTYPDLNRYYVYEILDGKRKGKVKYQNIYSCHFASMGLSKIYIPIDRIKRLCGFKLAIRIVENWIRESPETHNSRDNLGESLFGHLTFLQNETGKTIVNMIDRYQGRSFELEIGRWINKRWAKTAHQFGQTGANVIKELKESYKQYIKENIREESGSKGIYAKCIENNVSNAIKEMEAGIIEKTNRILDKPALRFEIAIKMLLDFTGRLKPIKGILEKNRDEIKMKAIHINEMELRLILEKYSSLNQGFTVLKKSRLKKLGFKIIKKLETCLTNELRILLLEGAIKVIDHLRNFVGFYKTAQDEGEGKKVVTGGLIKKLSYLKNVLNNDVLSSLQGKYQSFSNRVPEYLNISFFNEELVDNYFKIKGKPIDDHVIYAGGREFSEKIENKIIGFIDFIEKNGEMEFQQSLEEFCSSKFSKLKIRHEVIKMLYDEKKRNPDKWKRLIGWFIGLGHPWIKDSGSFLGINEYELRNDIQKYSVLGVYPGSHYAYKHFKDHAGVEVTSSRGFHVIDSEKEAAYFYSQWKGFPIMYIDGIREWYDRAYITYMDKPDKNLHIEKDYHKYDEIIPFSQDEVDRLFSVYRVLILGFILGVIAIGEETKRKSFRYSFRSEVHPGIFRTREIGNDASAIETLLCQRDLRNEIDENIASKKIEIDMDTEKTWNYYALLNYYWENVFPLKYMGGKTDPIEMKTFEHRVVEEEMRTAGDKLDELMKAGGYSKKEIKQAFQDKLASMLSGIDAFSRKIGNSNRRILSCCENSLEEREKKL